MTRLINDEYMGVLISEWHQIYSPLAVIHRLVSDDIHH